MLTAAPDGTLGAQALPVDTDQQQLSISGATISLTNGGAVTVPSSADNLGNHTATQNLRLGTHQLTGNGGPAGLRLTSGGVAQAPAGFQTDGTASYAFSSPKNRICSVSFAAFNSLNPRQYQPIQENIFFQSNLIAFAASLSPGPGGAGYLSAPLQLPHGARITSLTLEGGDDDRQTPNPELTLIRLAITSGTASFVGGLVAKAAFPGEAVAFQTATATPVAGTEIVDNGQFQYVLIWRGIQGTAACRLVRARVAYTVGEAAE